MSEPEFSESSDSDAEVSFKQKNKVKSSEQLTQESSAPGGLRRGARPRVPPRSYADFLHTPTRQRNRASEKDNTSDDTDSELEKCRQKTTSLFTNDDVEGQDMFKFKSRHTKLDLQNKVNSALSSPRAAADTAQKTPRKSRLSMIKDKNVESTPKHVKEIMKKRIINTVASENSDSDFSASSSDFVPEKSDEESSPSEESEVSEEEGPRKTRVQLRRTDARSKLKRDTDYVVTPDSYFMMHSSKKITTSDHTLERLKNYNPTDAQISETESLSDEHKNQIRILNESHRHLFNRWLYLLSENYSILLYGVGSKRAILHHFQTTKLKDFSCAVVNGFFPSLTVKSILEGIVIDLLEQSQVPSSARETVNLIEQELTERGIDLFLIIHNIDGVMLQSNKAQTMLASLSQLKNVHTIASIDHINAPLIWDHTKLSKFNFTWWDVTSFAPYSAETSFENSLTSRRCGALQLSSLMSVHRSLTSNSKKIFNIIVEHQLQNHKLPHYQGLSFKDLYSKSREQFLVSSDIALRAQLTEFFDHKLVKMKRSGDGENLIIPIDHGLLQQFLDQTV